MHDSLSSAIREAVASGEFERAEGLWSGYVAQLSEELRQGAFSEASLAEAGELVDWTRRVVLCARAHTQDSLNSVHVAEQYEDPRPPQGPRLIQTRF